MPFKSSSQMKAAFSGALGPVMKKKAKTWAAKTPDIKNLPNYARRKGEATKKKYNLK